MRGLLVILVVLAGPLLTAQDTTISIEPQCKETERKRWYDDRLNLALYGSGTTLLGDSGRNFGLGFQTNLQAAYKIREFKHFSLGGYADLGYAQTWRASNAELSNVLEAYGAVAGAQLGRELPKKFSVYLNVAAGLSYSLLLRGQDNAFFNSRNVILRPSAEVRYRIRDAISAGIRLGYSQILYSGSDLRAFEAGLGVAYAL